MFITVTTQDGHIIAVNLAHCKWIEFSRSNETLHIHYSDGTTQVVTPRPSEYYTLESMFQGRLQPSGVVGSSSA